MREEEKKTQKNVRKAKGKGGRSISIVNLNYRGTDKKKTNGDEISLLYFFCAFSINN